MSSDGAIEVNEALIAKLIADQHPDLEGLDLRFVTVGWDNSTFRLGTELSVRAPRREPGAALICHERKWLPILLEGVPGFEDGGLDASAHLRAGEPGLGYRWPWAIGRWHTGIPASVTPLTDPLGSADRLGEFLAAQRCLASALGELA